MPRFDNQRLYITCIYTHKRNLEDVTGTQHYIYICVYGPTTLRVALHLCKSFFTSSSLSKKYNEEFETYS